MGEFMIKFKTLFLICMIGLTSLAQQAVAMEELKLEGINTKSKLNKFYHCNNNKTLNCIDSPSNKINEFCLIHNNIKGPLEQKRVKFRLNLIEQNIKLNRSGPLVLEEINIKCELNRFYACNDNKFLDCVLSNNGTPNKYCYMHNPNARNDEKDLKYRLSLVQKK